MFRKILIANRGEIACRVIRTCRRMGIATVAVYSEADDGALHVRMADEAVYLGPPPPGQSYLLIDRIAQAIRETGAEAVHPGFGFLSENAQFVKAVEDAGAVFIGPPVGAVAAMGDKIESKKIAREAGVNVIPGVMAEIDDPDEAVKIAQQIGYPVMVKAAAGGGGKGMRVVDGDDEAREGFRAARSEAETSFGDGRVFLEKFIENPRHIEIQLMADGHGNVIWLNERECSIQRRHQKVVEEAPSPLLDAETRRIMGEQACALARAVDYRSAGTVEFVSDQDKNFYFLEMNTRLQVEHPVTEMITGLDLVEQMIRVAAGETLAFTQDDVGIDGWAMEARIYAEDPYRGFLPSIGRLSRYRTPEESATVRIDSGVEEGSEVTMFYDPMIAKLVVHGPDRAAVVVAMQEALNGFQVRGVRHNIDFLGAIMRDARFQSGALTTAFVDETWPDGFSGADFGERQKKVMAGVGLLAHLTVLARDRGISGTLDGPVAVPDRWMARFSDDHVHASARLVTGGLDMTVDSGPVAVRGAWRPGQTLFEGTVDSEPATVQIERHGTHWHLVHAGVSDSVVIMSEKAETLLARMPEKEPVDTTSMVLSPMPGMIVDVLVNEGDRVEAGQALAIVDAMKMENILRAERSGEIGKVHTARGDSVAVDQLLLEFAA
ncbi:MAG: acetyl/propionyl/methylcrotonyl-CoA carboxylase subunit alpha [Rhodospirillales bacterium]|nr:acetyl/propionyl/methylcrotonyl-CoA carboxylase subunit alpha [Rhodospirillales bacterium]